MIYEPAEDSFLLASVVKKFSKDKYVLDMGSGSGVIALAAKENGARDVLAADINEEAVKHIQDKGVNAIQSNLFEKIKGKFDVIAFNPPYLPRDENEDKESSLITSAGKEGDEIILHFLKKAPKYLNPNGKIFLLISSLTPKARINILMNKLSLSSEIIASEKIFFEELYVLRIEKHSKA